MPTLLNFQATDASGKMFTVRPNVLGLFPRRSSGGWNNRRSAVRDQRSPQSCSILSLSPLIRHFPRFFHTVIDDRFPPSHVFFWLMASGINRPTNILRFFYIAEMILRVRTGTVWLALMVSRLGSTVSGLSSQARTRPCPAEVWRQHTEQRWTESVDRRQGDSFSHLSLCLTSDSSFVLLYSLCPLERFYGWITWPSFGLEKK